jgi:hypothetical protein
MQSAGERLLMSAESPFVEAAAIDDASWRPSADGTLKVVLFSANVSL